MYYLVMGNLLTGVPSPTSSMLYYPPIKYVQMLKEYVLLVKNNVV